MSDETNPVEAFDLEDRPAAGTACVRCKRDGHFCGAKGYAGEDALCLACGTGEPCGQRVAVVRLHADLGWEDGEVDPRGLHGECRAVAIEEADRSVDAPAEATGWQAFKQSLSVENLKCGPHKIRSTGKSKARLDKQRDAGRRRRMNEVMESRNAVPLVTAKPVEVNSAAFCAKGCGRPARHKGRCAGVTKPKALKPVQALKRIAPIAAKSVAPAPVVEAAEMVSVRMPASSLDALFRMLPTKAKVAAVEQLLAGVAGVAGA